MIPWIQVYSNLPQHPKTARLADELGLASAALNPNALAVGLLVSLWTWAIQNATDGDLSACSPRSIADACTWKRKPDKLIQALQTTGWLDADMKLHDWEEYAALLMEQEENRKAKTRDRVRRYRERKQFPSDAECNVTGNAPCNAECNVTETLCNASTIPNLTKPYSGGGGDTAREETANRSFAQFLVLRYSGRDYTDLDAEKVQGYAKDGTLSEEAKGLLRYAFSKAAEAGKGGDWRYIEGIMGRLYSRGIHSAEEAEQYDWDRAMGEE